MGDMSSPPDLDRRISRKLEGRKAIQLSPTDLDLLVESGAIDVFRQFVADYQRTQCRLRSARDRSINGGNTLSIVERGGPTSKSSGMTQSESASEALAQARQMCGRDG
jgi:hypothetical protein